jgi:GntR family transcriptional repressor for pyruvate dehydrogenase complex
MSGARTTLIGYPVGGRETLLDSVAKRLIQLLMGGHYQAGEKLPSELELASQFNVGRGTIREAIKALAIVGFVRAERGKGTFVADRSEFLIGPISLGFESSANLDSLIETRKLIEVHTARLAARHATKPDIAKVESHVLAMERAAQMDEMEEHAKADVAFHFAIADVSQNALLSQFLTLIRNLMQQWVKATVGRPGVAQAALTQHKEILEAIRSRNEDQAAEAMARHLDSMAERLLAEKPKSGNGR